MTVPSRPARVGAPIALWVVTAASMARDAMADPYDPLRAASDAYGHNSSGALWQGLAVTSAELLVLYAILRPWSYARSWGRAAVGVAVFLPWTMASLFATMHAGGIFALHFLWVALVTVATAIVFCVSFISAHRTRELPGTPALPDRPRAVE